MLQIAHVSDSFRNVKEHTNNYNFRKQYLLDLIEKEQSDKLSMYYWIVQPKSFYNLPENDQKISIEKKIKSLFQSSEK